MIVLLCWLPVIIFFDVGGFFFDPSARLLILRLFLIIATEMIFLGEAWTQRGRCLLP